MATVEAITNNLNAVGLEAKSKVNINIVFIGHVDAGKSTICGNILNLMGKIDKRTLEKYERESKELNRESWYLSWALDTSEEERAKGITVECGKEFFETDNRRFTILDAPGHKNYVPNMLAGAAQADVAVLVISARIGEFETGFEKGGQTREHAMLVKTVGVRKLIVVINKMDEPSVKWSQTRFDEITGKLNPYLKSVGFNVSEGSSEVIYIPISGFAGYNLKEPVPDKICPWYKGQALLPLLDTMPLWEYRTDLPFIMPITGKYKDLGVMVIGKLEIGKIKKDQKALLMPIKREVEITGIYIDELEINSASAGDNVRLKLKGVEEEDITAGFILCDPAKPVRAVTVFQAQIQVMDIKNILTAGYKAVMHVHTATEEIMIKSLVATIDKKTGERLPKKPLFAKQGDVVIVELELLNGTVCLDTFKECSIIGRFILRDEGKTVGAGKVLSLN